MSLEELTAKLASAVAANDTKAIEEIATEIVKSKAARRKAEADAAVKEAEALAGTREALSKEIHRAIKGLGLDEKIVAVKGWGFTYKVDKANPNEPDTTYKSVSLSTQTVKARKAGGNGGAGKTKDEFGLSLGEVFEKFATAEDRAKLAEAETKDKAASEKLGKQTNSNAWRVKNDVKKAAIASGALAPVK